MGTKNKNSDIKLGKARQKSVRMAYTLNNTQPVQCTLVSDQPFFYIDEEVCIDDDILFGEDLSVQEYSELEENLLAIKNKIDGYEKIKKKNAGDCKSKAIEKDIKALNTQEDIAFEDIHAVVKQSRFLSSTMDILYDQSLSIEITDHLNGIGYNTNTKSIRFGIVKNLETAIILFAKALRFAWQDYHNAYDHVLSYFPDHAVLIHRAQTADIDVFAIRAAWELHLAGQKDLWNWVENSSYADLARAFGREAHADFRALNNGKANAAAFETWFLSDRVREQDQILIQHMLDFQDQIEMDKMTSEKKAYKTLCQLGLQPYGKNYLMPYANMIMQDSLFTEMRDRANANFLWFIKFERSFTQTEQSLQSDVDNSQGGGNSILSFAEITNKDSNEEHNVSQQPAGSRDNLFDAGNNIVIVDFGNGEAKDDQLPQRFE